jgi:hypothetical protein
MPFLGMWISFEIHWISLIKIYLLFNVEKFKEYVHLNKPLSKSFNLNVLIIFWASILNLILGFQKFWQFVFQFLGILF